MHAAHVPLGALKGPICVSGNSNASG